MNVNDSIGEQSLSGLHLVCSSMKLQQVELHYRNWIASFSEECDLYKAVVLLPRVQNYFSDANIFCASLKYDTVIVKKDRLGVSLFKSGGGLLKIQQA